MEPQTVAVHQGLHLPVQCYGNSEQQQPLMMQQIGMAWWRGDRGGDEKESSGARRKRQRGTDERIRRRNKSGKRKGLGTLRCQEREIIQWSRFIGLPPIHQLSKLGMCVVKRIRFDELCAATVSDRSYDQRFKKSTFSQLLNLQKRNK